MAQPDPVTAPIANWSEPCWSPLEKLLPAEHVGEFMWMHEARTSDGRSVHAYKHMDTRRYIHLDNEGNAYTFIAEDQYRRTPLLPLVNAVYQILDTPRSPGQ